MKDKFGYEIPDKGNKVRKSTEHKSGTWRDDEFENTLYDIIDIIQKKYPDNMKMQKTLIITLPNLYIAHLLEQEIEKHEKGEMPRYRVVGRHMIDLYEGLDIPKKALREQYEDMMKYLISCPKLNNEELGEELK